MLEVTQADRDAATEFVFPGQVSARIASGRDDSNRYVQAFARHRIAERERCAQEAPAKQSLTSEEADDVERVARAIMQAEEGGPLGYFANNEPMRDTRWGDFDAKQHEEFRRIARAAIAAMRPDPAMVLVPREPSGAMIDAGYDATRLANGAPQFFEAGFCLGHAARIYAAMIAAHEQGGE